MTPEECKKYGAHCYEQDISVPVPAIYPPPTARALECKHCGQRAVRRIVVEETAP
jgi:hypothetical protein